MNQFESPGREEIYCHPKEEIQPAMANCTDNCFSAKLHN
jgi:hypothetical protein